MVPWILWVCVLMFYFDQPQYTDAQYLFLTEYTLQKKYYGVVDNKSSNSWNKYYVHIITNIISVIFWGL